MSKIKTYKVTFLNKDFLAENNLPDDTIGKIESVYNAEDHALYGKEYGY